jgi:three-Cys-motif partner protein
MELWPIARHTAAKHAILKRYLDAWLPIMGRYNRRLIFVDGFAGPGEYANGEPGSPIIALDCALNHTRNLSRTQLEYVFIEQDPGNRAHLGQLLRQRQVPPHVRYELLEGQFDRRTADLLDRVETGSSEVAPAFVMIDPFGFSGVPFDIIQRLARQPKSEVLVSLMSESINRFLDKPELETLFDSLFGTPAWRNVHGLPPGQPRWNEINRLYASQLEAAGFKWVRAFEMRDDGGRIEYHLTFATHGKEGLRQIKNAMWHVDPSGLYRFSDSTNPDQLTLFQPQPDYAQLEAELLKTFGGRTASIAELEDFVLCETAFRVEHLRRALLAIENSKRLVVIGERRRKGTYPEGVSIQFSAV